MKITLSALLAVLTLAGCNKPASEGSSSTPDAAPAAAPAAASIPAAASNPALLAPEKATEKAPETFKVRLDTTQGPVVIAVTRAWSPLGADRFYNLVKLGYYDGVAFFRVLGGFMAQTGIHGDPAVNVKWRGARFPDDPMGVKSNTRGMVTFATAGPQSRTSQIFFNYGDNSNLDPMGFTPFGQVVEGMERLDKLYNGYGEGAPSGPGPDQGRVQNEGNAYLKAEYPKLDYIKTARLES
ncbi:MAG: peptidylprolyl isomerase [Elusimicrobiota bacterium]|nr:peptidylprolyl isomerase [Elusimicrobiota bacterium]